MDTTPVLSSSEGKRTVTGAPPSPPAPRTPGSPSDAIGETAPLHGRWVATASNEAPFSRMRASTCSSALRNSASPAVPDSTNITLSGWYASRW
eukprot:377326-Prymnesium_polylepis.1